MFPVNIISVILVLILVHAGLMSMIDVLRAEYHSTVMHIHQHTSNMLRISVMRSARVILHSTIVEVGSAVGGDTTFANGSRGCG